MTERGLDLRVIVGTVRRREVGDGMERVADNVLYSEPTLADGFSRLWRRDGTAFGGRPGVGA